MIALFDLLQQHARQQPGRIAVLAARSGASPEATTYADLAEEARRFAAAFFSDASASTFIPLVLERSAQCIGAMMGALQAGRAFVCVNPSVRVPQLAHILDSTAATTAVIDGSGLMILRNAEFREDPFARPRWWVMGESAFGSLQRKAADRLAGVADVRPWDDYASTSGTSCAPVPLHDRAGCCLFTSGSTGSPKGVLIAERDLAARAEAEARWYGLGERDVVLNILPFSFDVGLNQVLSTVAAGSTLVIGDSWLPADILSLVARFGVTGISAVPSIWSAFLDAGMRFDKEGPHASLRYITVSGGDLSPAKLDRLPSMAPGVAIFKTYGQTETFRSTSLHPSDFETRRRSVGRAFPGARVYVVRGDGTPAAPDEVGEVVHTGLGVMMGYLGEGSTDKLRPNPFRGDGDSSPHAIFTGDLGYLDRDGYLYLVGRRDDMLKVSGIRVYPREIANALSAMDGVLEAEVVGVKDAAEETRLIAFVTLRDNVPLIATVLRRELAKSLPPYMVPHEIEIVHVLPRTASGKPDRVRLLRDAARLFGLDRRAGEAVEG